MATPPRKGPTMIQRSRALRPSEKATYHNVTGAGRSRVLRRFFGFAPDDLKALEKVAAQQMSTNFRREG